MLERERGVCGQTRRIHTRGRDGQPDRCARCVTPTKVCGVCGRLARIAISATPDRPAVGECCYHPPVAVCSRCGQQRPCYHAGSDRPMCVGCAGRPLGECGVCGKAARIARRATATSPQVGICCYRLPLAVCTDCRREQPCYWASSQEPVCTSCTAVRRAPICLSCGHRRVARRRVDGGVLCGPCDIKLGGTTGACRSCGQNAPLLKGVCVSCQLRERIAGLAADADPHSAVLLAPFLRDLADAENPRSTLRWFDVTRRMLAGEISATHHGLDEAAAAAPNPVKFVRAKLVASGVLEPRDQHSARFAAWHATAVLQIAPGGDRAHVRAYATWQVAHQLARTVQRRGEATESSQKYARSLVTQAIDLARWLHARQLELADLRQDLVDQWIAAGSGVCRRVRPFLGWLTRAGITSGLTVEWDDRVPTREAITDEQRFAILRRLLHDEEVDLRDRLAGSVLLLYGKPLTKIAQLRSADLNTTAEGIVTLRLGRGQTPLPEPLGMIALGLQRGELP